MLGRIIKSILFIAMIGSSLSLGVWQVYRLGWKNQVIRNLTRQPADMSALNEASKSLEYRRVVARGQFVADNHVKFFINRNQYQLITPFKTSNSQYFLINRGIWERDRILPKTPEGLVTIEGHLQCYFKHVPLLNNALDSGEIFYVNIEELSQYFGVRLQPCVIRLPISMEAGLLDNKAPNIYNHHLEYAIMWFLMAISGTLILILRWRKHD